MRPPILGAQPLSHVLFGDYLFRVPDYQRDFVWGAAEADRLLDTLVARLTAGIPGTAVCYLNNIVVNARDEPTAGEAAAWPEFGADPGAAFATGPRADLVDGQQRLTVLTILAASLRDRIADPARADRLHRMVAAAPSRQGGATETYIVAGTGPSGELLRHTVQPRGATLIDLADSPAPDAAAGLLAEVRARIVARIDAMDTAAREALADLLGERCYLSMVVVSSPDPDWGLFSELNDSGVRLSRADRLKAALLGQIPQPERAEMLALWQERKRSLAGDFDGEGRRYLFSYIAELACPGTSGTIAERVVGRATEMGPLAFMREVFDPFSAAYATVMQCRYDLGDEAQNRRIGELVRFVRWAGEAVRAHQEAPGNPLIAPLILWLAANRRDPARTLEFLTALDRTLYGMLIHHGPGQLVNDKIAEVHQALEADAAGFDLAARLAINAPSIRKNLERSLLGIPAKLVLVRLEAELEPATAAQIERCLGAEFDIEHVLPRNAGKAWLSMFGGKAEAKTHLELIGNKCVMLRTDNRKAGNRPWGEKRKLLERVAYLLPLGDTIRTADPWNADAVMERHRRLMETADRIWDFGTLKRPPQLPSRKPPKPPKQKAPQSSRPSPQPGRAPAKTTGPRAGQPTPVAAGAAAAPAKPKPTPARRRRPPHLGGALPKH